MYKFYKIIDFVFKNILRIMAVLTLLLLIFIIVVITKESLVFFKNYSFVSFITGTVWKPLSKNPSFGILPIILGTIFTSVIAIIIALPIGVFTALFTSCVIKEDKHKYILPIFNILAGIPSVVYGFCGLMILVKFFEKYFHFSSGENILAGGILLAVMILPYIISTCHESMVDIKNKYALSSMALGVSKWYMIKNIVLKGSRFSIITALALGLSRALGETMAVMMVIGNSPIMPSLLSRGESLSGLIALEMGGSALGSLHYHGLYGAGFVLIILLIITNSFISLIKNIIEKKYLR